MTGAQAELPKSQAVSGNLNRQGLEALCDLQELPERFQNAFESEKAKAELACLEAVDCFSRNPQLAQLGIQNLALIETVFFEYCAQARNACREGLWTVLDSRQATDGAWPIICDFYFRREHATAKKKQIRDFQKSMWRVVSVNPQWKHHFEDLAKLAKRDVASPAARANVPTPETRSFASVDHVEVSRGDGHALTPPRGHADEHYCSSLGAKAEENLSQSQHPHDAERRAHSNRASCDQAEEAKHESAEQTAGPKAGRRPGNTIVKSEFTSERQVTTHDKDVPDAEPGPVAASSQVQDTATADVPIARPSPKSFVDAARNRPLIRSYDKFAAHIGIGRDTLYAITTERRWVSDAYYEQVAKNCGCKPEDLHPRDIPLPERRRV